MAANPELWNAYQRNWSKKRRASSPGIDYPKSKKWALANPDKIKAQKRRYYLKHRERLLLKQKLYYNNNFEKCAASMKEFALKNPEKILAIKERWNFKNKSYLSSNQTRRRSKMAGCFTDDTADAFRLFVRSKKRIKCYYCGEWVSGKKAHIDHVIAVNRQGNHASDNLAASCPKCNLKKSDRLPAETHFKNQPLLNL